MGGYKTACVGLQAILSITCSTITNIAHAEEEKPVSGAGLSLSAQMQMLL